MDDKAAAAGWNPKYLAAGKWKKKIGERLSAARTSFKRKNNKPKTESFGKKRPNKDGNLHGDVREWMFCVYGFTEISKPLYTRSSPRYLPRWHVMYCSTARVTPAPRSPFIRGLILWPLFCEIPCNYNWLTVYTESVQCKPRFFNETDVEDPQTNGPIFRVWVWTISTIEVRSGDDVIPLLNLSKHL